MWYNTFGKKYSFILSTVTGIRSLSTICIDIYSFFNFLGPYANWFLKIILTKISYSACFPKNTKAFDLTPSSKYLYLVLL